MKMNKHLILASAFLLSLALYYAGFYLGDLVGIGGYDGEAPESLYYEFQSGKYANTYLYGLTTVIALTCLTIGPLGILLTLLYIVYLLIKTILRKLQSAA